MEVQLSVYVTIFSSSDIVIVLQMENFATIVTVQTASTIWVTRKTVRRPSRLVWTGTLKLSGPRLVKVEVTMKGDTTKAVTVSGQAA